MSEHPDLLTLDAFSEGEMTPEELRRTEAHLAVCPTCRRHVLHLREPADWFRRAPYEMARVGLVNQIVEAVSEQRLASRRARRLGRAASAAALSGAALLAVSWSELGAAVTAAGVPVDANTWNVTVARLLEVPVDTATGVLNGTLAWQAGLAESAGAGLVLGMVLLTAAAFVGLTRLLQAGASRGVSA
jgi:anti-sigma factor RsiW